MLFLSGGGDRDQTRIIDQRFAEEIDKAKPLLYIPAAMEASRFDSCFQWIKGVFAPLGVNDIVMWPDVMNKRFRDLARFSAVYIGGGNTFRLLKRVTDTRFNDILQSYAMRGGVVYGGSAGAVILGKHIMTCSHMDDNNVGLNDFDGLGLAGGYSIWCHYNREDYPLINTFIKEYGTPVISLPEETAILAGGGRIQVIGTKPACVFTEDSKTVVDVNHFIKKSST